MKILVNQLADHSFLVIGITILSILIMILLISTVYILKEEVERHGQFKEEREFFEIISQNPSQIQLMVREEDLYPLYVSNNVEEILGINSESVKVDVEVLFRAVDEKEVRRIRKMFQEWEKEDPLDMEIPFTNCRTKEEGYKHLHVDYNEEKRAYAAVIYDITRLKSRQNQLETDLKNEKLENQAKTDFLSKMSHEIRTPMNGILGMLALAKMDINNPVIVEDYLDKAENLSQFLLNLINDILDMSRIESGKTELEKERFDLYDMAKELRAMFQKNIEEKGVKFQLEMKDFDVRYVVGDKLRLTQVIINFISNSIKFTESGGLICITFRQMQRTEDELRLMIRVRDTGKGIEPDFLSRIFKPFEQESTKVTKKYGGTGLGMAIADNIIRLMGGQIVIDSELGKGTDFTVFVSIPIAEGPQDVLGMNSEQAGIDELAQKTQSEKEDREADAASTADILQGIRILMAEDNDINAKIASTILEKSGMQIERAVDGRKVVDMFAAQEEGYYQVILMDIQMPQQNGWEATKEIRGLDKADSKSIPIIALSANAFVEDKRKSVECGMNDHVSKPINFEELKKILVQYLK